MTNNQHTPQVVWEQLHNYVRQYDAKGQASLFADDGVWEFPFASEGIPPRIEGKEQILAFSEAGMSRSKQSGRQITGYRDIVMHTTTDPEVIVVEFILEGRNISNKTYTIPYIQVLRVKDGKIVLLRDYFSGELLRAALTQ